MDSLTRQETLEVLQELGVDIPKSTRLSDDVLDKRLRDALNAAQYKDRLPPSLDLQALPEWPQANPPSSASHTPDASSEDFDDPDELCKAVQRINIHEYLGKRLEAPEGHIMGLRFRVLPSIGRIMDFGARWCVLDADESEMFIALRVRGACLPHVLTNH